MPDSSASSLEEQPAEPTAWEGRRGLGRTAGFFSTWRKIVFSPEAFWKSVQPTASVWPAFFFAWAIVIVSGVLTAVQYQVGWQPDWVVREALERLAELFPQAKTDWLKTLTDRRTLAVSTLQGAAIYPLWFFGWTAVLHAMCRLCGCADNGYRATLRAIGYASAPALLAWIPNVGYLASLYAMTLEVWALARLQRASIARAVMAHFLSFMVPLAVLCLPLGGLLFLYIRLHQG